jgi:hypothetical protein
MISEPMVRLTQTVHLSYVKISIVSKQTEVSLDLVTKEYHRVRPKWFLSWWYVWRKLCTYLALTLTMSPNRMKWDSMWPTSPRNSIGCVENDFWAYDMSKKDQNKLPHEPCHLVVPSSMSQMISEPMVCLAQTKHLSFTEINAVSKQKEVRFHVIHVT